MAAKRGGDLNRRIVRVRDKREYGWTPKAYKERESPSPDKLVQSLKSWKEKDDSSCPLVFPNFNWSSNGHFLRTCSGCKPC